MLNNPSNHYGGTSLQGGTKCSLVAAENVEVGLILPLVYRLKNSGLELTELIRGVLSVP